MAVPVVHMWIAEAIMQIKSADGDVGVPGCYFMPRKRKAISMSRIITTVISRTKLRLWLN